MKGLNHLVLAGHDLDRMRAVYHDLGFTLTAAGQHPFGTGNTIIQLHGTYLELLAVTRPQDIVEATTGEFSFSAYNRDYLQRHEGFSMTVFDTPDSEADIAAWSAAGLRTYAPFHFSRQARMPDGEDVTVGFSLAFVSNPACPWLAFFACQHYRPEYYAQPQFMSHANGAHHVSEVWITGDGALALAGYVATLAASSPQPRGAARIDIPTANGTIVLATGDAFAAAFGVPPPHPQDGPHFGALVIATRDRSSVPAHLVESHGDYTRVAPDLAFGTVLAFSSTK